MTLIAKSPRLHVSYGALTDGVPYLAGDSFEQVGVILLHIRGGEVIAEIPLPPSGSVIDLQATEDGILTHVLFVKERRMPGSTVSQLGVQENQSTGQVTFSYSDGENEQFENWAAVGAEAEQTDADTSIGRKILRAISYRESPDGANKTSQNGAQVQINCSPGAVPVVYTPPLPE